jgi:hypothetical protein
VPLHTIAKSCLQYSGVRFWHGPRKGGGGSGLLEDVGLSLDHHKVSLSPAVASSCHVTLRKGACAADTGPSYTAASLQFLHKQRILSLQTMLRPDFHIIRTSHNWKRNSYKSVESYTAPINIKLSLPLVIFLFNESAKSRGYRKPMIDTSHGAVSG